MILTMIEKQASHHIYIKKEHMLKHEPKKSDTTNMADVILVGVGSTVLHVLFPLLN